MKNSDPIQSYRQFWPYYLREHARHETRILHVAGTGAGSLMLAAGLYFSSFPLVAAALLTGYGLAWAAHSLIEKNRPATFRYPLWSLISDFRMTGLWLCGRLNRELESAKAIQNNGPG